MPDSHHHHNGAEKIIRLFEEKLVVDRSRRKVGEISIRKEIDTEIVEVPVRRERLIVERIDSEPVLLAEIEIGRTEVTGEGKDAIAIVTAEFTDLHLAAEALKSLALQDTGGCERVRVQLILEDESDREVYRNFLDRPSKR
jgi:hypothetical protein